MSCGPVVVRDDAARGGGGARGDETGHRVGELRAYQLHGGLVGIFANSGDQAAAAGAVGVRVIELPHVRQLSLQRQRGGRDNDVAEVVPEGEDGASDGWKGNSAKQRERQASLNGSKCARTYRALTSIDSRSSAVSLGFGLAPYSHPSTLPWLRDGLAARNAAGEGAVGG